MSFFIEKLKEHGKLEDVHITVAIVGSRKLSIEDDYGTKGWNVLGPHLTIYGFDADPEACEQANVNLTERQVNWTEKHIPLTLSCSEGTSTLYVTEQLACTSLYPSNQNYLERFRQIIPKSFELKLTVDIETTTLDGFCQQEGVEEIDFLQVDVQGADLDVLKGASNLLARSLLAIQTEVEFSPLYVDQPLFSDLDLYLRNKQFSLFDLEGLARYPRARSPIFSQAHPGQLLWADAYYFRDLIQEGIEPQRKTPLNTLKLACIVDILGFPDYALELLEFLTIEYGSEPKYNVAHPIIESLSHVPELVEQGLNSLPIVTNLRPWLD